MGALVVERQGYKRTHSGHGQSQPHQKICFYWQPSGHCDRHQCPFLHPPLPHHDTTCQFRPPTRPTPRAFVWKNPNYNSHNQNPPFLSNSKSNPRNPIGDPPRLIPKSKPNPKPNTESPKPNADHHDHALCNEAEPNPPNPSCNSDSYRPSPNHEDTSSTDPCKEETQDKKVCANWLVDKCDQGDGCKFLHSGFVGQPFSCLATLKGHEKAVSGITLPQGSSKLFSASKDGVVCAWDCSTGKCVGSLNLGGKIGCILIVFPWAFIGGPNTIKVFSCNPPHADLNLSCPIGQVYALEFVDGMLFAGIEDGTILSWAFTAENLFQQAAAFTGHNLSVVTLVARSVGKLLSGSMDHTIKVWDIRTSQCLQTLTDHNSAVMSILCWDQFFLSCSLDQTIKVWWLTEAGNLELYHTQHMKHEIRLLCGMEDELHKPAIVCTCNDSVVRLYDLPSFEERGRIFCKEDVRMTQTGPEGLLFIGDARGELKVWKMLMKSATA